MVGTASYLFITCLEVAILLGLAISLSRTYGFLYAYPVALICFSEKEKEKKSCLFP